MVSVTAVHRVASVIGIVGALSGIASFFLSWCEHDGSFTGLDFLMGDASSVGSGFQEYIPLAVMILMVFLLALAIRGLINRNKGFTSYGILLFGFIALGLTVVFGTWTPQEELKMMLNGGIGLYLELVSCSLYIIYGLIEYTYRP